MTQSKADDLFFCFPLAFFYFEILFDSTFIHPYLPISSSGSLQVDCKCKCRKVGLIGANTGSQCHCHSAGRLIYGSDCVSLMC